MTNNGSSFSNWLNLMLNYTKPYYEVVVLGTEAELIFNEMNSNYLTNFLLIYSEAENNAPLLENRLVEGKTLGLLEQ